MASRSAEYEELHFTGESAEEAEDFIQAVNKRAYAAGKQNDNAWIAEFAYPFFSRQALRWYEELDEETQNDWKLLKRAIFAEFGRRHPAPSTVPSAALASSSSSSSHPPAAPPPSTVATKLGRIRIHCAEGNHNGYLTVKTKGIGMEAKFNEASVFEGDTLGRTIKLKGETENLVIRSSSKNASFSPGTSYFGLITRTSYKRGNQWSDTWSVAGDDDAVTSWLQADGRQCNAQFIVPKSGIGGTVYVPADSDRFLAEYTGFTLATLHFEPMS